MGRPDNRHRAGHYEAALGDYLSSRGTPFIAVDESRRVIFAGAKIKSFDFLIYPSGGPSLIADVKGRKFPYRSGATNRYWENWVTQADLEGLQEWERVFGDGYRSVLVFSYQLGGSEARWPLGARHSFRDADYSFLVVGATAYAREARVRSTKWDTMTVPTAVFRRLAMPLGEVLECDFVRCCPAHALT